MTPPLPGGALHGAAEGGACGSRLHGPHYSEAARGVARDGLALRAGRRQYAARHGPGGARCHPAGHHGAAGGIQLGVEVDSRETEADPSTDLPVMRSTVRFRRLV
eukprot:1194856-Prorocentrum_minimum.AAC.3